MAQVHKVISVFDTAAQVFARPFFVTATGQAIRDFTDEINREAQDNPLFRHPDDFILYQLGEFDDETGSIRSSEIPSVLVRGKDVKKV